MKTVASDELARARLEIQRLEAALWESEARQKSMVDTLSEGILVRDADGTIRLCNNRAASILGMSPEEIMSRSRDEPLGRAIREDGTAFAAHEYPTAVTLSSGWPQADVVMGMHRPDGTLVWISVNCQPLNRPDDPLPYAVIASFSDITERRRAQVALLESQSRLQLLNELARAHASGLAESAVVETTVAAVAAFFPRLRVTFAALADRRLRVLASRAPETNGSLAGLELDMDGCAAYVDALARGGPVVIEDGRAGAMPTPASPLLARTGARAALDVPVSHDEGALGLLSLTAPAPRRWSTHEVATMLEVADALVGALRQARALEARRRAEEAARESEGRFRRLTDASHDGILISDRGVILEANERAAEMFGYGMDEMVGIASPLLAAPEAREMVARMIREGVEGTYPTVGMRRDGTRFDLEVTGKTISFHGRTARVTVLRDVTERKAVDRLKNEFVSTVSHELRTPLTSIRGSLGLLEGGIGGSLSPQGVELVRIARSNADRLIRLINDILDLEKMEAGKLVLKIVSLDAADLVAATFDGIRAMAEQRRVRLESHLDCRTKLAGDRDRLIQVLTNLVSNALKFAPEGSSVVVRASTTDAHAVRFTVEDSGPGIPKDMLDRLFKKFQQLDGSDTRARGGTGLGLSISRTIVEQHGGRIGVTSEPGHGSAFWFELPLPGAPSRDVPTRPKERASVLLVESDAGAQELIARALGEECFELLRCDSLAAAERVLAERRPRTMLLGTTLTDGSGLEFLERLREREPARDLPAIVLARGRGEGMYARPVPMDWLPKPFGEERLVHALSLARGTDTPRALLVDDDDGTRTVLATLLRGLRAECVEAADLAEALRAAHEAPPDLILLDVGMPRSDGFEVVEALRDDGPEPMPLVLYTGRDLTPGERQSVMLALARHLARGPAAAEKDFAAAVRGMVGALVARNGRR